MAGECGGGVCGGGERGVEVDTGGAGEMGKGSNKEEDIVHDADEQYVVCPYFDP